MNKDPKSPEAKLLLQKYLDKTATPEEEQQVLRWFYTFGKEDDLPIDENEQHQLLQLTKQNILAATRKPRNRFSQNWLQIAALLVLCCTAAVLFGIYRQSADKTVFRELSTQAAQHKTITLSDGTRISLNNASSIKYPEKFNTDKREVELDGEAFFEVAHNPKRPFIIHTGKLKVQVLGTSFNVRSYAADKEIAVNVTTGKVAVTSETSMVMLVKDEGAIYSRNTKTFSASTENAAMSHAWQNDVLYFRYQTLEYICSSLERWYGVRCIIKSSKLKQKKYTLEQHHETLNNVMKVLSAGEFNYKITGKTVEIW